LILMNMQTGRKTASEHQLTMVAVHNRWCENRLHVSGATAGRTQKTYLFGVVAEGEEVVVERMSTLFEGVWALRGAVQGGAADCCTYQGWMHRLAGTTTSVMKFTGGTHNAWCFLGGIVDKFGRFICRI
jgi:hypothetical protein